MAKRAKPLKSARQRKKDAKTAREITALRNGLKLVSRLHRCWFIKFNSDPAIVPLRTNVAKAH